MKNLLNKTLRKSHFTKADKNSLSVLTKRSYAKKQEADVPDRPASELYEFGPEGYLWPGKVDITLKKKNYKL